MQKLTIDIPTNLTEKNVWFFDEESKKVLCGTIQEVNLTVDSLRKDYTINVFDEEEDFETFTTEDIFFTKEDATLYGKFSKNDFDDIVVKGKTLTYDTFQPTCDIQTIPMSITYFDWNQTVQVPHGLADKTFAKVGLDHRITINLYDGFITFKYEIKNVLDNTLSYVKMEDVVQR